MGLEVLIVGELSKWSRELIAFRLRFPKVGAGVELQLTGGDAMQGCELQFNVLPHAILTILHVEVSERGGTKLDHTSVASEEFQTARDESKRQPSLQNSFQCVQNNPKVGTVLLGE